MSTRSSSLVRGPETVEVEERKGSNGKLSAPPALCVMWQPMWQRVACKSRQSIRVSVSLKRRGDDSARRHAGDGPDTARTGPCALSRAHDLRRTVATGMASLGVNPHTISLVLDHISVTKGTVTSAVYVKYSFDREKRDALERWATHLEGLVGRIRGKLGNSSAS